MALRLLCGGGGGAFLCNENRLPGRLRLIRRSRLAPRSRWPVGVVSPPAAAIPPRPMAAACCSVRMEPASDETECVDVNAVTLRPCPCPCGEGLLHEGGHEAGRKRGGGRAPVSSEKMDRWMHECIVEIVRNIGDAPFLVYAFCNNNNDVSRGGGPALRLEMEAADPETWGVVRSRWDRGVAIPPDGVILVEELQGDDDDGVIRGAQKTLSTWVDVDGEDGGDEEDALSSSSSSSSKKTWGILVQGWGGVDCGACYILNTCRVGSALGFCTHFCLTRARCFEETADMQLKKLWLVGGTQQAPAAHRQQP